MTKFGVKLYFLDFICTYLIFTFCRKGKSKRIDFLPVVRAIHYRMKIYAFMTLPICSFSINNSVDLDLIPKSWNRENYKPRSTKKQPPDKTCNILQILVRTGDK